MLCCLCEQENDATWVQKVREVQRKGRQEIDALKQHMALMQEQLDASLKENIRLRDRLHELDQEFMVRQDGFSHIQNRISFHAFIVERK